MLVGGQGTRLRPLTLTTPKPMLPLAGEPFVMHQLSRLAAAGVDHVVLATSYKSSLFEATLGDGSALGLRLEYVLEEEPLGTGGGIRNVVDRLHAAPDDPVLILNGDILSHHSVSTQLAFHRAREAVVTLHLTTVDDPRAYGCVPIDDTGRVTEFLEKDPNPVTNLINAGCYIFARSIIDQIPGGRAVSVERETFPGLLAAGAAVYGYVETAYWLDLGTPEAYVRGNRDVVLATAGAALIQPGSSVDPAAKVDGGSCIGSGATVAAGAVVSGSVVLPGARIGAGCSVRDSAVGAGAVVGADTVLDGAVLGDLAQVGAGNELRHGARLWPGAVLADRALRFSTDV